MHFSNKLILILSTLPENSGCRFLGEHTYTTRLMHLLCIRFLFVVQLNTPWLTRHMFILQLKTLQGVKQHVSSCIAEQLEYQVVCVH